MLTDDAFLQAILAEPDDDTHRLVYADWLEEFGDAAALDRAALIRAQVEAYRMPPGRKRSALQRTAKKLIKAHPEWTADLWAIADRLDPEFQRGFVHKVRITATAFARNAEALFAAAPLLRAVDFGPPGGEVEALVECPFLSRVAEAEMSQHCFCGGLCSIRRDMLVLFASPYLAGLTRLVIVGNRLGPEGAIALAETPHLSRLRELDLTDNDLGNAGARALLNSPWIPGLSRLVLTNNGIGVQALRRFRKRMGDAVVL